MTQSRSILFAAICASLVIAETDEIMSVTVDDQGLQDAVPFCDMRIVTYNIWMGMKRHAPRFQELGRFLQSSDADVVALQECVGWRSHPLATLAKEWGYQHYFLMETNRGLDLLLLSRSHPIEVVEQNKKDFRHGLLHAVIKKVHFLVTHSYPSNAIDRTAEMYKISNIIEQFKNEPTVVLGDLNTLSPLDHDLHFHDDLVRQFNEHPLREKLQRKFMEIWNATMNYTPMNLLLKSGLIDEVGGRTLEESATVPTNVREDPNHAARMRLDYILVNKPFLARFSRITHSVIRKGLENLSDHFPVTLCATN